MNKNIQFVSQNLDYYRVIVYRNIPKRYYYLAEDIAQDAAMKSIVKISQFDSSKGSFKSWMYRLTQNLCFDAIRKMERIPTTSLTYDFLQEEITDFLDEGDKKKIRKAIRSLSDRDKKIILLKFYFNYSGREIANELGIPERHVPSCCSRAKGRLKKIYKNVA